MAIIYDATTSEASVTGVPHSTHTFSHTITTSENRALVVMCTNNGSVSISSVTWNGVALTSGSSESGSSYKFDTWYLLDPDSGTHDVVITFASAVTGDLASAVSLYNVNNIILPIIGASSSPASTINDSITVTEDSCLYIFGAVADSEPSFGGGETVVTNIDMGSSYLKVGYGTVNTGTTNIYASQTGASEFNLQAIVFSPITTTNNASALLDFI